MRGDDPHQANGFGDLPHNFHVKLGMLKLFGAPKLGPNSNWCGRMIDLDYSKRMASLAPFFLVPFISPSQCYVTAHETFDPLFLLVPENNNLKRGNNPGDFSLNLTTSLENNARSAAGTLPQA